MAKSKTNEQRKSKYLMGSFWGSISWSVVRAVLLFGIAFIILYPLIVKISSSLMTERDLLDLTVKWIPRRFTLETVWNNYRMAFHAMEYAEAFRNSFLLTVSVSSIQLLSCTVIGYGFARFRFPGMNVLFAVVVFTLLVPPQMVMVPLFLNFRFFDLFGLLSTPINLIGTYWPFYLTALMGMGLRNGLFIYIMRQFFRGMPKDLEEAALVDGAGQLRIFFNIMLPGAVPAIVIVFLFSFVWQWNDLYLTTMYLRSSQVMLPFTLERFPTMFNWFLNSEELGTIMLNTGMLLFIAPVLILYAFLQRYFIESVERTGIVG